MKTETIPRWLAVGAGGDAVRLVPVPAPSTGPDVFVKLHDAEAALAAAVAAVVHDFKASGDTELDELVRQAMRDLCTRMGIEFKA